MPLLQIDRQLARDSYYAATAPQGPGFAPLQGTVEADVAIVGGGLAGLSAALELSERGFSVALMEAGEIGGGASGRNGGQALAGLACDMAEVEGQLGLAEARRIWAMSLEAVEMIRQRSQRYGIDCEWQDGFLSVATSARKAADLQAWQQGMAEVYGYEQRWIPKNELANWIASPRYQAGVHDPASGHLHPLKYCRGLAQLLSEPARRPGTAPVQLFEHSPALALEQGISAQAGLTLRSSQGQLRARFALLAGNVYLPELAPELAPQLTQRIMPVGTYIGCSAPIEAERLNALIPSRSAVCDNNFVLDYFRPTADQRLLYGGRVSYSTRTPRDLKASMATRMQATFPQLADIGMDYAWGGFVDISMNRAPDFGRLGTAQNIYYLQGFSGHGLALTGLAGQLVAEAIADDASRFDCFAALRHRPFPGGTLMRMPALVLGMAYYRLKDLL
ncbi:FAD-dependent oxidoreductase [Paucibacter aquatile]|uniref:FAD-dependent oxidoreductase n=1 Tax=Kinneretia aquatilis TaxID=2070761 RepID=A0A2N8KSR3_9BURK|nr:FAD-binding oxidoreductase [Paucibacter aquatile]PND36497.1 FAD-dependent oxidoreductase [Paucibacter aquatile]